MKAEQQILNLLGEILQVIKSTTKQQSQPRTLPTGIYPHQSKYNPFRATVWDKELQKTIMLGAFPSITRAKAAQTAYRKNKSITDGTRAAKLSVVKKAA